MKLRMRHVAIGAGAVVVVTVGALIPVWTSARADSDLAEDYSTTLRRMGLSKS